MSSSPKSAVFRGDQPELVDHLIFACNAHKANSPGAGFGRELEPFFAPGESLGPLPARKFQSCGSPPRIGSASSMTKAAKGASRKAISPPEHREPLTHNGKSVADFRRQATRSSATPVPRRSTPGGNSPCVLGSSPVSYACPAYFSSPKPDSIPMPTTGLLSKAGSIKRTSVEGPRDFFPGHGVAFVNGFTLVPTAAA